MSPQLQAFLWGAGGSIAVEIFDLYNQIRTSPDAQMPTLYRKWYFWLLRVVITVCAGMLVVAENVTGQPFVAVNIGASAPAIFKALTQPNVSAPGALAKLEQGDR